MWSGLLTQKKRDALINAGKPRPSLQEEPLPCSCWRITAVGWLTGLGKQWVRLVFWNRSFCLSAKWPQSPAPVVIKCWYEACFLDFAFPRRKGPIEKQAAMPVSCHELRWKNRFEPGGWRWRVFMSMQFFLSVLSLKSYVVLFCWVVSEFRWVFLKDSG